MHQQFSSFKKLKKLFGRSLANLASPMKPAEKRGAKSAESGREQRLCDVSTRKREAPLINPQHWLLCQMSQFRVQQLVDSSFEKLVVWLNSSLLGRVRIFERT
jgi:hypothetical protein